MPEDFKLNIKAYIRSYSSGPSGSVIELVSSGKHLEFIDPNPYYDRLIRRDQSITLKNFDIHNLAERYNQGIIDVDISIPIFTDCELKKSRLKSEIRDIEKRLEKLSPMKNEIAALESKLKEIKEDCSGN